MSEKNKDTKNIGYCLEIFDIERIVMRYSIYTQTINMNFRLIGILLLILMLSSCNRDSDMKRMLSSAESLMNEHPDSALTLLENIEKNFLSKEEDKARYALLLTQARNKCYICETDDSLINVAVRYYNKHSSKGFFLKSCFYKAEILFNKQEYNLAVIMAMKAYELAKETDDFYWIAKSDELLSNIFSKTYNNQEALKYSAEAALYYKKAGKMRNHRYALCDLAVTYANIDSLHASLTLLDSIKSMASIPPMDSALVTYCIRTYIPVCLYNKDFHGAKSYIKELSSFKNYYELDANEYTYMAEVAIALGEQDSLTNIINSAQSLAKTLPEKATVNSMMANYFISKNQFKEAQICTDSALVYQNKVVSETLKQSVVTAQRDFYNAQSESIKKQSESMKRVIIIGVIAVVCISALCAYFYRLKIRIKNGEIEKRMNEILVLSEKIQNKNNENIVLSSTLSEKDDNISHLNGKLVLQQNDINQLTSQLTTQQTKSESLKNLVENLFKDKWKTINLLCDEFFEKGNSEKAKATIINEVEKEIKRICNPKNLKAIETAVNDCMDGIVSKLRVQCPFLKPEDILFITLLYAGFAPWAVCIFTGIKLKYFYNKRSRLSERIMKSNAPEKILFVEKMK